MFRLKSHSKVPPGQYFYVQYFEKNGRKLGKHFTGHPEAGVVASRISSFRKANLLPRSDIVSSLEDLDKFTVDRLGSDSTWVHDTDVPWDKIVSSFHGPGCATCGKTGTQ